MKSKTSVKLTETGVNFLKKFRTNRRKAGTDEEDLSYWKLMEIISKFFKDDNDAYLKLIKSKEVKNE